jgi:gliding motility-associated-like protein
MVKYLPFARIAAHLIASLFFLSFISYAGIGEPTFSVNNAQESRVLVEEAEPAAPIFVKIMPGLIRSGRSFWVEVHVGTENMPVDSLFGLSFELNYTFPQYINVVKPDTANLLPGTLLGSNVVFLAVPDSANGAISVGISRKAGNDNVSGYGAVFRAQLFAAPDIPDSTTIAFSFARPRAQDKDGNPVQLVSLAESAIVLQPENFTLNISPTSDTVAIGQQANFALSMSPAGGFNRSVPLSVRPEQPGISATLSRLQISPSETASLVLIADSTVTPRAYVFEVVASIDTFFKTIPCTLYVFSIPIFPASESNEYPSNSAFRVDVRVGVAEKPVMALRRLEFTLLHDQTEYVYSLLSDSSRQVSGDLSGEDASVVFEANQDGGRIKFFIETSEAGGVSGFGSVVKIPFASKLETPDATPVMFSVENVVAMNANGQSIFLKPEDYSVTIREKIDFVLGVEPDTLTISAGETAEYLVHVKGSPSFNAPVTFSLSGEPRNANVLFSPEPIFKDQNTFLSIESDSTILAGMYPLLIKGTSGSISAEARAVLVVTPAPVFSLVASPQSDAIFPGDTASFVITIAEAENLKIPVNLELPATEIYQWLAFELSPRVIDASQQAELSLFIRDDAPLGSYHFRLIGRSGTVTRVAPIGLDILEPPPPVRPIPFTPNNDGFNDYVYFDFEAFKTQAGEIMIFDLHGRKIVELRGVNRWDGRDENGKAARPGAYLYVVRVGSKILKKGILALAR